MLPREHEHGGVSQSASSSRTAKMTRIQIKAQKIRALRLLLSYAIAVKHHLRGEYETHYDDYVDVLPVDLFGKQRDPLMPSLAGMSTSQTSKTSKPAREDSPLLGQDMMNSSSHGEYTDEKKYPF